MFKLNNIELLADDLYVLEELVRHLRMNEIDLIRKLKRSGDNIQFTCPIHSNGQENKPSCGISTRDKERNGVVIPSGTVHCFSCGYTATLQEMVSHCFGRNDDGYYGTKWLMRNFTTLSVESRKDLDLNFSRGQQKMEKKESFVTEEELDTYRYYNDYMFQRKLTNEIIEIFDVGYDRNFKLRDGNGNVISIIPCLTFPVRDENGNALFIARRSTKGKFFHYPQGADKPVYGLYELMKYYPNCNEIIVCESILNALTCWTYGKPAVAMLGLGTKMQYQQLRKLKVRKIISGFDPDDAGQKAAQNLEKQLKKDKLITFLQIPAGKDINDLSEEEFMNLKEFF